MSRVLVAVAGVIAATIALSCAPTGGSGARLTVFAAASLGDALDAAIRAYSPDHPGVTIDVSVDSSAALRIQIEQGAAADVYLSADRENAARLAEAGLLNGAPVAFAANTVVVAVPSANPAGLGSAFDIAADGVKVVAANREVPITGYATTLVEQLAALPGAPSDFGQKYAANIVSREANVGAVVAKLELDEADAGIVYRTDIAASNRLREIALPPGVAVTARYEGVVLGRSAHPGEATAFLSWLAGPDGQAVLGRFGFAAP